MTPRMRSSSLLPEVQKGRGVKISVDGILIDAHEGETIAAALLSAGIRTFRLSLKHKGTAQPFLRNGNRFECLVRVDGLHAVRAVSLRSRMAYGWKPAKRWNYEGIL